MPATPLRATFAHTNPFDSPTPGSTLRLTCTTATTCALPLTALVPTWADAAAPGDTASGETAGDTAPEETAGDGAFFDRVGYGGDVVQLLAPRLHSYTSLLAPPSAHVAALGDAQGCGDALGDAYDCVDALSDAQGCGDALEHTPSKERMPGLGDHGEVEEQAALHGDMAAVMPDAASVAAPDGPHCQARAVDGTPGTTSEHPAATAGSRLRSEDRRSERASPCRTGAAARSPVHSPVRSPVPSPVRDVGTVGAAASVLAQRVGVESEEWVASCAALRLAREALESAFAFSDSDDEAADRAANTPHPVADAAPAMATPPAATAAPAAAPAVTKPAAAVATSDTAQEHVQSVALPPRWPGARKCTRELERGQGDAAEASPPQVPVLNIEWAASHSTDIAPAGQRLPPAPPSSEVRVAALNPAAATALPAPNAVPHPRTRWSPPPVGMRAVLPSVGLRDASADGAEEPVATGEEATFDWRQEATVEAEVQVPLPPQAGEGAASLQADEGALSLQAGEGALSLQADEGASGLHLAGECDYGAGGWWSGGERTACESPRTGERALARAALPRADTPELRSSTAFVSVTAYTADAGVNAGVDAADGGLIAGVNAVDAGVNAVAVHGPACSEQQQQHRGQHAAAAASRVGCADIEFRLHDAVDQSTRTAVATLPTQRRRRTSDDAGSGSESEANLSAAEVEVRGCQGQARRGGVAFVSSGGTRTDRGLTDGQPLSMAARLRRLTRRKPTVRQVLGKDPRPERFSSAPYEVRAASAELPTFFMLRLIRSTCKAERFAAWSPSTRSVILVASLSPAGDSGGHPSVRVDLWKGPWHCCRGAQRIQLHADHVMKRVSMLLSQCFIPGFREHTHDRY